MAGICAKGVSFSYGHQRKEKEHFALRDINFEVQEGESIGIIGSNGAGKSTLLKLLIGIEEHYTGLLQVGGIAVEKQNLAKIREKTGYVFQSSDNQLFMTTVYDDVAFAPENYGMSQEEVKKRTKEALEKVHMEELAKEKIYRLSGGQKKLAAIAAVLSMQPDMLIMDEPSAALDPKNRRNLIHVINELKITKIIASHDLDFIYDTCERTILLCEGNIAEEGKTREILHNEELLEKNGLELPLSLSGRDDKAHIPIF